MKAVIWLRVAAVLTLLHAALHTAGGVFGKVAPGPASVAVAAMQANRFAAMGADRSYWELYRGMGLGVSIFLVVEGIVFWRLGALARSHSRALRPLFAIFAAGYVVLAVDSSLYFFAAPVVVELLIAACLGLAWARAGDAAPQ